ncbi:toll/interleukin-1 receptor domain-containing protein [Vibrio europaeus]|uniref:hypothetical protein n=1 Tax=Vibrio europaeus TaxID=300876 RepID=UPI00234209FA|nr:hypothetical protein [Vibrio europaeus]MDC5840417.1 toll/interleukin-1 receptor domain-containing protein [Vibrio europaeus]
MFKGYDIVKKDGDEIEKALDVFYQDPDFIKSVDDFLTNSNTKIHAELDDFYFQEDVLDGKLLQNTWFPFLEDSHIFLSHSHKDKRTAETVAYLLHRCLDINVFIDSQVWGYADDLLQKIDDKYSYQKETNTYSYSTRNRTTSNIYLILQNSLNCMIDKSECLLFLNTGNTIEEFNNAGHIDQRTSSPWIMSELQFSSMVRRREHPFANRNVKLEEHFVKKAESTANVVNFEVSHVVATDHLIQRTLGDIFDWLVHCFNNDLKGYQALTSLYEDTFKKKTSRTQIK